VELVNVQVVGYAVSERFRVPERITAAGARHTPRPAPRRAYFGPDNPELLAFEDLRATYAKSDNILFVFRSAGEGIFSLRSLDAIETLTEEAWLLPYASRVDSVTNFQHSYAEHDDLTVHDLVNASTLSGSVSEEDLYRLENISLNEPISRTTFRRHGKSNWVSKRTWSAISNATRSIAL